MLDENKKKQDEEDSTMAQANKTGDRIAFTVVGIVGGVLVTAIAYALHVATK